MSEHSDLLSDLGQEDLFEREMRGYSRRQVGEFVARNRSQIRDLEARLAQAMGESQRLRAELAALAQRAAEKPAHEEISERVGQILRLAEEEAKSQRDRASSETARLRQAATQDTERLRAAAKTEADKLRAGAQEQAERMLSAAREQSERSVATALAEAQKIRAATQAEAERVVTEATKRADGALATAQTQARKQLDEATTRASAIHDGAERRLSQLTSRHADATRRLAEIRDVVATLIADENSRGSLAAEVSRSVTRVTGRQPQQADAGATRSQQAEAARPDSGTQQGRPAG